MVKPKINNDESIRDLMKKIEKKELVIPVFQRDFVWYSTQIEKLIISILQEYYVGTVLSWKINQEKEPLKTKPFYGIPDETIKNKDYSIILDGQQRLTSLYYAIYAPKLPLYSTTKPYKFFINLNLLLDENFDDSIIILDNETALKRYKPKEKCFENWIFPLTELKRYEDWLYGFGDYWEKKIGAEKEKQEVRPKITGLRKIFYYFWEKEGILPIIELPEENYKLKHVCDIFERINSTGTKLTVFDLLNARLLVHDIELSEEWKKIRKDEYNYPLIKKFSYGNTKFPVLILQAISLLRAQYKDDGLVIANKSNDLVELSSDNFLNDWNKAVKYTEKALNRITTTKKGDMSFGVINKKYLPYQPMIPVLAVLLSKLDENKKTYRKNSKKVRVWYWSAVFTNAYAGSTDSQMAKDFREVLTWFKDDDKIPSGIESAKSKSENLKLYNVSKKSNSVYKGAICLITLNGAKDFITNEDLDYKNIDLDDHHLFPESKAETFGVEKSSINTILNKTLIKKESNREIINAKYPSKYLEEIIKEVYNSDEKKLILDLNKHLISEDAYYELKNDHFNEFTKLREETIKKEVMNLIEFENFE